MITHTKKEIMDILKKYPYLISFLQKKRLFFKYVKYCMTPNWDHNIDYINRCKFSGEIVMWSFQFHSTKEGYDFWSKISDEYCEYYDSHYEL